MTLSTRILMSLVFLAVGLAGVGSGQRGWMAALGLQWQSSSVDAASRRMDAQLAVVGQRIKAKSRIVQRLDDGELGLFEAAAWFAQLNRTPPECQDVHWHNFRGGCDGEKLCRQVISWMGPVLRGKGSYSQAQARLEELEEELEQHIACHGEVLLPDL